MTCMLKLQVRGSMRNTTMTMRAYGRLIFFHVHSISINKARTISSFLLQN
jgi:hypothetical protein